VFGEEVRLEQVCVNLISNALDAMGESPIRELIIAAVRDAEQKRVALTISDTGEGIAPENMERIFDPFFTTKEVGQGTGLGLSVSYSITEKHNGRIEVESVPGEGSTFTLLLPVTEIARQVIN
jgi:signal transduction histidine kinase